MMIRNLPFARRLASVAKWPLWDLPRWASLYVIAVILAFAAFTVQETAVTAFRFREAGLFALFVAFGLATVELTRADEHSGVVRDAHGLWYLAVATALPPLYALLAPVPLLVWLQYRVRRGLIYRRVFSAASNGISIAAASLIFHATAPATGATAASGIRHPGIWLLIAIACATTRSVVSKIILMPAVKSSEPTATIRGLLWDREALNYEAAEICAAVLIAFAVAQIPAAIALALPFGMLLHRSVRHSQLVSEARIDAKTRLLNSAAWNREAVTHITRAAQAARPLALALIDVDHFKQVNDSYGHLVGDQVLLAVADTIRAAHRASDVCGRFGGEEFVLLLPDATAAEARQVAERLRAGVAGLRVPAGPDHPGEAAEVTVSVGVAVLSGSCRQLTDLMAAADAALYYAKETGRNRVRMAPEAAGVAGRRPGTVTGNG